jgi:hypothetical protein
MTRIALPSVDSLDSEGEGEGRPDTGKCRAGICPVVHVLRASDLDSFSPFARQYAIFDSLLSGHRLLMGGDDNSEYSHPQEKIFHLQTTIMPFPLKAGVIGYSISFGPHSGSLRI